MSSPDISDTYRPNGLPNRSEPDTTSTASKPITADDMNPTRLAAFVLQSKKALQQGEHLCTEAHTASHATAQAAIDVLELDAKVRWIVDVVVEQLKLAANVAKAIEEKRAYVEKQIHEWDTIRSKRTDALDAILESLGSQVVPPDFYETSIDGSLFGSQHPADLEQSSQRPPSKPTSPGKDSTSSYTTPGRSGRLNNSTSVSYGVPSTSPVSPSSTIRRNGSVRKDPENSTYIARSTVLRSRKEDRRRWKTLRDFVDDQAIEDTLEMVDNDRSNLDKITGRTDEYPETLTRTIQSIQSSLPFPQPGPGSPAVTQNVIMAQDERVNAMASVLENLASHYNGMATALKEAELGEVFDEEDWQVMIRDTDELPTIIAELEESAHAVHGYHDQLASTRRNFHTDLDHLRNVLDNLDELGEIMDEMISTQEAVETEALEELNPLHSHLTTLEQLHEQYVAYRMAFNKLMLEIARRQHYRESAENIARGMMRQLESMTQEEDRVRSHFNAEYGQFLPEDLCLSIANGPTVWEIVPVHGSTFEVLPHIDNDLIEDARKKIGHGEREVGVDSP